MSFPHFMIDFIGNMTCYLGGVAVGYWIGGRKRA